MAIRIDLQNDADLPGIPAELQFRNWVEAALQQSYSRFEQTIRVVDMTESRSLNKRYRAKDAPTNVLAFADRAEYLDYDCLGDLVICAPLVTSEAEIRGRTVESHWAHLVVHGMLHLQGFDHAEAAETERMEALEIKILDSLGYANPYNG
jgi:probable rRNA maturation factor